MRRVSFLALVAVAVFLLTASIENVGPDEVVLVGAGDDTRELDTGLNLVRPFRDVRRF